MSLRIVKRLNLKTVLFISLVLVVLDFFGVFTHIFEKEYSSTLRYPFEGDITHYVDQLERSENPDVAPINVFNYTFILNCDHKCKKEAGTPRIVYLIKSALKHFNRRLAIRNSWGFEGRFSDVMIRRVFLLGVSKNDPDIQKRIVKEHIKYKDIVQANFLDSYYNNTIKTMTGFKWAMDFCPNSRFYFFSDDDMYVSTKNLLRFIRNPTHYPHYLDSPIISMNRNRKKREISRTLGKSISQKDHLPNDELHGNITHLSDVISLKESFAGSDVVSQTQMTRNTHTKLRKAFQVMDFDLPDDALLWAGYVLSSSPHRHKSSRWYVSLSEYPYDRWPTYVTAGAYVLSRNALRQLHFATMYTKHFKFDDIFLALAATKIGLEPFHSDEFHFYKNDYSVSGYRFVVASHGYGNPKELLDVWNEQRSAGNA